MKTDRRLKRCVTGATVLVLALLFIFTFFYIRDRGGRRFIYGRDAFSLAKVSSNSITLRSESGEDLVFTREEMITAIAQYQGYTIRYGGGYDGWTGAGYTFSDGTRMSIESAPDYSASQLREVQLIADLNDYFNNVSLKYRYPFYYIIGIIMLIAAVCRSMYIIFYTAESWEKSFFRRLFVRGGEPTDFALFTYKAAGVIVIMLSFLLLASVIGK